MIRVRIKSSSRLAQAGLERLLQPNSALRLVEDSDARGLEGESAPDVLLVEADTLADSTAREAIDWAGAGVPVVLLVRNPSAEPVARRYARAIKAVLPERSGRTGNCDGDSSGSRRPGCAGSGFGRNVPTRSERGFDQDFRDPSGGPHTARTANSATPRVGPGQ